jgi:HTH-type transcriptional regulator, sugar sensing transcriptional regulator
MQSDVSEITAQLTALGFTAHEARVYVALLGQPGATGYEIARVAGIHRANVYGVLGALLEKNAIQVVGEDPLRYAAHAPADVLGKIKRETAARCDTLVDDLSRLTAPDEPPAFWTLRGREAVVERVAALIGEARERVAICLWADDLAWAREPLRRVHAAGCAVVVNLFGAAELEFGEIYQHEDPARVVTGHLLTLCVDTSVALVAALDESPGAVYTQHPALVRLVEKLIRDEAYLAAIYARFGPELEREFGPHLATLRARLLPTDAARQLWSIVGFGAGNDSA